MTDKLNISLEPHLRDALAALLEMLPEETSQLLTSHLSSEISTTTSPVIPYEVILKISRWCQTADGRAALQARSPSIDSQSYTMVSLLAGTRTSPEKRFPPYAPKDPEEDQRLRTKERKAIATLFNAVLSVIGTGIATWWASEHTGMRIEWRTLSAIFSALVVAFAEIVLYIIWDSRQTSTSHPSTACEHVAIQQKVDKDTVEDKNDPDIALRATSTAIGDTNLRHRTVASPTESVIS